MLLAGRGEGDNRVYIEVRGTVRYIHTLLCYFLVSFRYVYGRYSLGPGSRLMVSI